MPPRYRIGDQVSTYNCLDSHFQHIPMLCNFMVKVMILSVQSKQVRKVCVINLRVSFP